MPNKYYHPDTDFWRKYDLPAPDAVSHDMGGTNEEIRAKMTQYKPTSWHMEGPGHLVGDTEMGRLVQHISTDYICLGTDTNGLPILRKVIL